jgi:predicted transcriptional regulator
VQKLTEFEKHQIQEMRIKGIGYKAIAVVLGMSRDVVRGYCKRNGLDGDAKVVSLNIEERKINNLICGCCNKELKQKERGRIRRFCSEECRRKWWNLNQDKRTRKEKSVYKYLCPTCGNEFSCYGNKSRKYCSHDCYIKSRFWKGDEDGI